MQDEIHLLRTCQVDSFPDEVKALKVGKQVSPSSRLKMLSPELDTATGLIHVGGHLRCLDTTNIDIHPISLDYKHLMTSLLIKMVDPQLLHPGLDRVFAERWRQYWVLCGCQAIKHHQRTCKGGQRWRGQPKVPVMADISNNGGGSVTHEHVEPVELGQNHESNLRSSQGTQKNLIFLSGQVNHLI